MENIKKVLLIGEWYSFNLGDGVICECVEKILRENYYNIEIEKIDLSGRRGYGKYSFSNGLLRKIYLFILNLFGKLWITPRMIRLAGGTYDCKGLKKKYGGKYDLVIFTGGALFQDYFCIPIYCYCKYFSKKGVPIIFNGVGFGKCQGIITKTMLRKALYCSNVKAILCRENTKILKDELGIDAKNCKLRNTYDIALNAGKIYQITQKKSNKIGIGLISLDAESEVNVLDFYVKLCTMLDQAGMQWQLFCNGFEHEWKIGQKIIEKGNFNNSSLHRRPETPIELVEQISEYNLIVSFRLHSHIIGASLGVKLIGINWDKKLERFFEKIFNKENLYTVEDVDSIYKKIINDNIKCCCVFEYGEEAKRLLLNEIDEIGVLLKRKK